jgi:DNA-binding LytR/AlgR family response regulator
MKERYSSAHLHYIQKRALKLRIAICDDEQHFRTGLKETLSRYNNKVLHSIEICEHTCGETLINTEHNYDIIFLDYKLSGIDGLDTAKRLRRNNVSSKIIFITNYPQFVFEAFEVKTFRFYKKPVNKEQLYKALDDYLERFENDYPLMLKGNREAMSININDIEFIKASNKKCDIAMPCNRLNCAASMSTVFELLPKESFCKVNKSFVVNLNNISKYTTDSIYFNSGNRAPIGRKYLESFRETFRNYAQRNST